MAKKETTDIANLTDIDHMSVKDNAADLLKQFEGVKETDLQSITAEYLTFKQNSKYNFVFMGFTEFTSDKQGVIKAARLIDADAKEWINANKVLTGALNKDFDLPALVRIVTKGEVKSDKGKYLDMEVFVIPVKK